MPAPPRSAPHVAAVRTCCSHLLFTPALSQGAAPKEASNQIVASAVAASVGLQKQMASGGVAGVRFATDLEFKAALPPPKLPGSAPKATGLQVPYSFSSL